MIFCWFLLDWGYEWSFCLIICYQRNIINVTYHWWQSSWSCVEVVYVRFLHCNVILYYLYILYSLEKSPYAQPTLKERGVVLYLHKDGITGINTFEFFYMGNLSVPHHLLVYLIIYINHFIEFFEKKCFKKGKRVKGIWFRQFTHIFNS